MNPNVDMNSLIEVSEEADIEIEEGEEKQVARTRNKGKGYRIHSQYTDEESATRCLTSTDGFEGYFWRYHRLTSNARGSTHWYRCVVSLKCPMVQMKVDTIEEHVIILIGTSEHDHNIETAATGNKYGIDPSIKSRIDEYDKMGVKPAAMLIALRETAVQLPTVIQLNNYLKTQTRSSKRLRIN
jgi:hypothetical protein